MSSSVFPPVAWFPYFSLCFINTRLPFTITTGLILAFVIVLSRITGSAHLLSLPPPSPFSPFRSALRLSHWPTVLTFRRRLLPKSSVASCCMWRKVQAPWCGVRGPAPPATVVPCAALCGLPLLRSSPAHIWWVCVSPKSPLPFPFFLLTCHPVWSPNSDATSIKRPLTFHPEV